MTAAIIAILFLLCCSAFFSGAESALTAASRPRLHALARQGNRRAGVVNELRAHMEQVIAAILLYNNLVNIAASALATGVMISLFGAAGIAYATAGMTVLLVLFGEVLPKTYAINNADRTALAVAPLMRAMTWIGWPLTRTLQVAVRVALRLVGLRGAAALGSDKAEEELRGAIDLHAETAVEQPEASAMLHSILDLAQVTIADIMVHRRNVTTIDIGQPTDRIVDEVLNSAYTRIPLHQGDIDNVVGVLHAKALLRAVRASPADVAGIDVVEIAAKPWFVPDSTTLLAQLEAFRERREHFALVVDEYGALMGIVTLEDILEEIVGQIDDEHDVKPTGLVLARDGSIEVAGDVTIRDLNREFGWRLPDEHASTIAGLVLYEARRIPEAGQVFAFFGFRFQVLERQRNQIKRLRITPQSAAEQAPAEVA